MNWLKVIKISQKIFMGSIDKAKLLKFVEENFGRGVAEKLAMYLNRIDIDQNGKINVLDLILLGLEKLK